MNIDNKYKNKIPTVEAYLDKNFTGFIPITSNVNQYYYSLKNDDNNNNYIIRIQEDEIISRYKIITCAAGGHGGLLYGCGGNGGRHIYIDNTTNQKNIKSGSYLIKVGKAVNLFNETAIINKINDIINDGTGCIYLNIYHHNINGNFFVPNLRNDLIRNYRKIEWLNSDVSSYTYNNTELINIKNNNIATISSRVSNIANLTFEVIFILKSGKTFVLPDFSSLSSSFSRRVFSVKERNTDVTNEITSLSYTAETGFDELITILFYKNNSVNDFTSPVSFSKIIDFSIIDNTNFYIYNYKTGINNIKNLIQIYNSYNTNTITNTVIKYNQNPSASFEEIDKSPFVITMTGGNNGIMDEMQFTNAVMLRQFYLDRDMIIGGYGGQDTNHRLNSVFSFLGGNPGTTSFFRNFSVLETNTDRMIIFPYSSGIGSSLQRNFKRWIGSRGEYINNLYINFNLINNENITNNNVSNGGNSGYWQFIRQGEYANQGANGYNNFNEVVGYGTGGYGASFLLSGNGKSLFNSTPGKNGVFILSFYNEKSALIVNYNMIIIQQMYKIFIISNSKLDYLLDINMSDNSQNNIRKLIKNSFITDQFNLELDLNNLTLTTLNEKINKQDLNKIIGIIYIIQRVFFVLLKKIKNTENTNNFNNINVIFVENENQENVVKSNNLLEIYISTQIKEYFLSKNYYDTNNNNYKSLAGFRDISYINISKDVNYDMNTSDISFIQHSLSSIFEIEQKDYLIKFSSLEAIFNIIQFNLILYAIFYNSHVTNVDYTKREDINVTYNNLYLFTEHIKKLNTDNENELTMKLDKNNIIKNQNEFKTYFYNGLNNYDVVKQENQNKINNLNAYKDYYSNKITIYKNSTILLIIVYIILIVLFFWFVYMMSYFDEYDTIPYAFIILLIVISIIIILNYNYYYYYTEKFSMTVKKGSELVTGNNYNYNKENFILHEITSNIQPTEIRIKNYMNDVSIMLVGSGTNEKRGNIHIYDNNFINETMNINNNYEISFTQLTDTSNIRINNTSMVTYNNTSVIPNQTNVYFNNRLIIPNYNDTNANIINNPLITATDNNITTSLSNINNAFSSTQRNEIYNSYGNIIQNGSAITNNAACIIVYKNLLTDGNIYDLQYFINKYNNNISKLLIDKFNKIYILDNQYIYDNAKNSFQNALLLEKEANTYYKTKQVSMREGSGNSLSDVYIRYEITKTISYLFVAMIVFYLLYSLNPQYRRLIITGFVLVFLFIIVVLFYKIHIYNTRRDYYKYYWGNSL